MHDQNSSSHTGSSKSNVRRLLSFSLAALGIVFGDIGTSPLYSMRECFHGPHGIEPTRANVFGVLSLIFWALTIVISIKYLVFILRADHRGEGGILALSVLVSRVKPKAVFAIMGLFGAALLYADGMITPAISVLSAVEGLEVAAPKLEPFVVPITIVILIGLFFFQSHGTAKVGALFGPVMLVWFIVIAILGISHIVREPAVFAALNPYHALTFFLRNGWHGFVILGAVFLVVTGGEALYADIGHFGVRPIRLIWFSVAFPALILNYLGQGALLLQHPEAASNPFFGLAPSWALYPLVALASTAAVIASQALITGAFSLTMQAIQLSYSPRLTIQHTSAEARGQIYLPLVNWALMLSCIGLVAGFQSSSHLAAAYGISITSTMMITTVLFYVVARWQWKWNAWLAGLIAGVFLVIDLAFLLANATKILHGGWLPLIVGGCIFGLMSTWRHGRLKLAAKMREQALPLDLLLDDVRKRNPLRVPGTAFFLSGNPTGTPPALLHNLKHNKVLHQHVAIVNVKTAEVPHVPKDERITIEGKDLGFWRITLCFGFMDEPNVPEALKQIAHQEFKFVPMQASYFLGRERVLCHACRGYKGIREALFAWMAQNARDATSFFSLPPNAVVELGARVEI